MSRNTVSKALNGSSGITNATRQRVIDQAISMNYKMMGTQAASSEKKERNILLVCKDSQLVNDFFGPLMLELQQLIHQRGAVMTVQYMLPQDIRELTMPARLQLADGVIGLEILDKRYTEALLSAGKPCVFFDCSDRMEETDAPFDVVLEGDRLIYSLVRQAAREGGKTFGFVGSVGHCMGFQHRYDTFRLALTDEGIAGHEAYSILIDEETGDGLSERFDKALDHIALPDVMCFANNHLCYLFAKALHARDAGALAHIKIISFGANNVYHSYIQEQCARLVTVKTDRRGIASALVMLAFDRIANPAAPRRTLFTESHIQKD